MIAYFDCFSGVSGDMVLGAIVDAGIPVDLLASHLKALGVSGYSLEAESVIRKGFRGTQATVSVAKPQPARHLADILSLIEQSQFPKVVKDLSSRVFRRLGQAEAQVHGKSVEEIHFHEVGAVDAIVDVVGSVMGLHLLGVDLGAGKVFASPIPTGFGLVDCAHGTVPVPAPATLALLEEARAPILPGKVQAELATPTGVAILTTLANFSTAAVEPIEIGKVGYGFGQRELPWPNALRLLIGRGLVGDLQADDVGVIEANIDDMSPELLGAAMDVLLDAGALDVFFTPIQMKKNRPAVKLSVIAPVAQQAQLAELVLRHTTSLGVRIGRARRSKCARWEETIDTPWGPVRVKIKSLHDKRTAAPEYDDCLAVSKAHGIPLGEVYEVVNALAKQPQGQR